MSEKYDGVVGLEEQFLDHIKAIHNPYLDRKGPRTYIGEGDPVGNLYKKLAYFCEDKQKHIARALRIQQAIDTILHDHGDDSKCQIQKFMEMFPRE